MMKKTIRLRKILETRSPSYKITIVKTIGMPSKLCRDQRIMCKSQQSRKHYRQDNNLSVGPKVWGQVITKYPHLEAKRMEMM